MRLLIDPQGDVHGVYSDSLPHSKLGQMEVSRASSVEYNHSTKAWEAFDLRGIKLAEGASRKDVIEAELQVLEERLNYVEIF